MSKITTQNAIRYNIDKIDSSSYGILITKTGSETDCSNASSINGFQITYSQPQGTVIRIMFKTSDNNNWFRLTESGSRKNITTKTPDYDILNENGNTVSELNALTSISAFKGKKVLIAVLLSTPDISNAVPKLKLSLRAQTSTQTLNHTETSPLYETGASGQIAEIKSESSISGEGTLKLYAQLTDENGAVSEWQSPENVSGKKCTHIRLKAEYGVKSVGSGTVKLESADIIYTDGSSVMSGAGSGEIVSLTQDWYMNVRHCRMNIRHAPLIDSKLEAYVCFRERPESVLKEQLGIGAGKTTTYQLKKASGVKYDTVKLYYDNERVYSDYEVNCEVGRITCTAPSGVIITCDYKTGWGFEDWQKMTRYKHEILEDYDASEYRYSEPEDVSGKSVCAVKIVMTTTTGKITGESVGKGTGKARTYKLSHKVKDGALKLYADGNVLSKSAYYLLEDPQYVKIASASGSVLTANYTWISESPAVYQFASVFSE